MNYKKNKIFMVVTMLFLMSAWVYAESEAKKINEQTVKVPKQTPGKSNSKRIKKYPTEFVPSEKIKSDASVAFPVDI